MPNLKREKERYHCIETELGIRAARKRSEQAVAALNDILRGAIVGAPAVEDGE